MPVTIVSRRSVDAANGAGSSPPTRFIEVTLKTPSAATRRAGGLHDDEIARLQRAERVERPAPPARCPTMTLLPMSPGSGVSDAMPRTAAQLLRRVALRDGEIRAEERDLQDATGLPRPGARQGREPRREADAGGSSTTTSRRDLRKPGTQRGDHADHESRRASTVTTRGARAGLLRVRRCGAAARRWHRLEPPASAVVGSVSTMLM